MASFFDNLGAAARHVAGKVDTAVSVAAQEQRVRERYQALGKRYYQAVKAGSAGDEGAFADDIRQIDADLARLRELRERDNVAGQATDEDFVDLT